MADQLLTESSYSPDNLPAGNRTITQAIILFLGQVLTRGALLGKITKALGAITADGGNTGDGVITGGALGNLAVLGTYTLECIAAAVNAGTFSVIDPNGDMLENAEVTVAYSGPIDFLINDGAADFIVGDKFTFVVGAGSGKYVLSLAAAVDGSQDPVSILSADTDATAADVDNTLVYISGEFNYNAMTFGAGHTAASVMDELRALGIFLKDSVSS